MGTCVSKLTQKKKEMTFAVSTVMGQDDHGTYNMALNFYFKMYLNKMFYNLKNYVPKTHTQTLFILLSTYESREN